MRGLLLVMLFFEGLSAAARVAPLEDPSGLLAFTDAGRAVIWLAMFYLWDGDRREQEEA